MARVSAAVGDGAQGVPVKDVAAAGGWKDITTLIDCYQQPDDDTLRAVVEFVKARAATFDDEAQGVRSRK